MATNLVNKTRSPFIRTVKLVGWQKPKGLRMEAAGTLTIASTESWPTQITGPQASDLIRRYPKHLEVRVT